MRALHWLVILLVFFTLLVVFFPKPMVIGGLGGFLRNDITVYREEFDCAGFSYDYYPPNCADCGKQQLCFGITLNRKCFLESYDSNSGQVYKDATDCRK